MRFLDRLLERFRDRQVETGPAPLPSRKVGPRTPVPRAATKAPFSRERRRLRNRAAHRSFMVNQRR